MKLKPLIAAIFILTFLSGCLGKDCTSKQTTNLRHLKRLLKTNKCIGCRLGDANLAGADLAGADLSGSFLVNAVLDDANLQDANLSGAELSWYDIDAGNGFGFSSKCNVDLSASLKRANLSSANLTQVKLKDVDLQEANLQEANLSNTYLLF